MGLGERFGIDSDDRKLRKRYIHLTEADIELLKALLPVMEQHVDRIVEGFYDHLLRFEGARAFFDEAKLNRVKSAQRAYLLDLCKGVYDEAYFERRLRIGMVHEEIGLSPKWYIGGNANFLGLFLPLLVQKYRFRPQKLGSSVLALVKIMNLDQQLVMDTYIGSMVEKLTGIGAQIRRSLDILAPTARQSARQAEAAAGAAGDGLALAEEGAQIVRKTLDGLSGQTDKARISAEQIHDLRDQVGHIESLAGLVSELTMQTDLLALKSAVEAARAGEEGAGFAVVAEEIRKLADQSKGAMARIHMTVTEILKVTDTTVRVSEESAGAVEAGTLLVERTGEAFTLLADSVRDASEHVQEISLNVKQQADAILQLQAMVEEIS